MSWFVSCRPDVPWHGAGRQTPEQLYEIGQKAEKEGDYTKALEWHIPPTSLLLLRTSFMFAHHISVPTAM
jgi:hypothetical protein